MKNLIYIKGEGIFENAFTLDVKFLRFQDTSGTTYKAPD